MNEARDKFLTELLGKCWHETTSTQPYHDGGVTHICKCGQRDTIFAKTITGRKPWERLRADIDFNSWVGFGLLWEFSKRQSWFEKAKQHTTFQGLIQLIDPPKFADALYSYLVVRLK